MDDGMRIEIDLRRGGTATVTIDGRYVTELEHVTLTFERPSEIDRDHEERTFGMEPQRYKLTGEYLLSLRGLCSPSS